MDTDLGDLPAKQAIGRFLLAGVVGRLKSFAAETGLSGRTTSYVLMGRELLPEAEVRENTSLIMRALNTHRRLLTLGLPFEADRISVRNNLRIIGIRNMKGATAKIQLARRGPRPSVMNELRARRIAPQIYGENVVRIPAVRAWDRQRFGWLIEDFVEGRAATQSDLAEFVRGKSMALYGPSARPRLIKRSAKRRASIELLEAHLRGVEPSWRSVGEKDKWLVGFGHHNLSPDNLLRSPAGEFWLVDWERAGGAPLSADLGRAYLLSPDLKDFILDLLASLDRSGECDSPVRQLALGAAMRLRRLEAGRQGTLADRVGRGENHESAARIYDQVTAVMRERIARLLK